MYRLDYSKSKTYIIFSKDLTNKIYFGATTQDLNIILVSHQRLFEKWEKNKDKKYISSFSIFEIDYNA
jgi:hypothetical protein